MVKKTIAIIGATEMIGARVAKNLAGGEFRLLLFGHDTEKLKALGEDIKTHPTFVDFDCLSCLVDAGWEADIIISAVPRGEERNLAEHIRQVTTQKIVVHLRSSTTRTINQDGRQHYLNENGAFEQLLSRSRLVKVDIEDNSVALDSEPMNAFISADDNEALVVTQEILTSAGFIVIAIPKAVNSNHR